MHYLGGGSFKPQEGLQVIAVQPDIYNLLRGPPRQTRPTWVTPEFLTFKNCEIINVYCFKWLSFEISSYVVVDNQQRFPGGLI